MSLDPTRAYFWPAANKMPTHILPGYFLTRPDEIFLTQKEKNWKFGILGEILQTQRQLAWPKNFLNPDLLLHKSDSTLSYILLHSKSKSIQYL